MIFFVRAFTMTNGDQLFIDYKINYIYENIYLWHIRLHWLLKDPCEIAIRYHVATFVSFI